MKTKNLFILIAACLLNGSIFAGVPIPTDTTAFVFKSDAGSMELEANRKINLYFKCSEPNSRIYIQWGDSTEAQEIILEKPNSLSQIQLKNIRQPNIEVKVWGKNISFLNCGGSRIYDFVINSDGKTINELHLGDNPIRDMKFLNDIDSLTYLVIGSNTEFNTLDLTLNKLARLYVASSTLTNIKLDCPRLYECKITTANIKELDLSKAVDLKTVTLIGLNKLEKYSFGKAENLERIMMSDCESFKSLTFENYPSLNDLAISRMAFLEDLKLNSLPKLAKLSVKSSGDSNENSSSPKFENLLIGNLPALAQIELSQLYALNNLMIENLPVLAQIGLSELYALKNLKLANLPFLNKLTITECTFKTFEVPDFPKLTTLTYSNSRDTEKITFAGNSLTSIDIHFLENLKEIDLTALKSLTRVHITNGGLEKLKFDPESWTANIVTVSVVDNHLTFPNIPYKAKSYPTATWNYYAPQAQLAEVPKDIDTDYIFDYSNWQTGDNGEVQANTVYKCITKFEEELTQGVDFKVTDGKVQFLKEIEDSVFIHLENAAFPKFERTVDPKTGVVTDYRVMTNLFKVNASQSGIEDVAGDVKDDVKVQGRVFMARGKKMVTVFDAQGRNVGAGNAVEVKSPGLYIAKCGKKAIKAMIK